MTYKECIAAVTTMNAISRTFLFLAGGSCHAYLAVSPEELSRRAAKLKDTLNKFTARAAEIRRSHRGPACKGVGYAAEERSGRLSFFPKRGRRTHRLVMDEDTKKRP